MSVSGCRCTLKIAFLSVKSGRSIYICLSNLPGRTKALSSTSALFVAANTITPVFVPKPSISDNSWLRVFSLSSLLPVMEFFPLALPIASISSIKIIDGAFSFACLNKSRTLLAPTPTNISTKSDPDKEKKGTFASPATAFAKSVLPVPGGPISIAPLGILPPKRVYFLGFFKKSTISSTSSLAPSKPATCSNVTSTFALSNRVALDFPILKICPPPTPPPLILFMMKNQIAMKNTRGRIHPKISPKTSFSVL